MFALNIHRYYYQTCMFLKKQIPSYILLCPLQAGLHPKNYPERVDLKQKLWGYNTNLEKASNFVQMMEFHIWQDLQLEDSIKIKYGK